MKSFLQNKKYWMILFSILIIISLLGGILYYFKVGGENYLFLYENMIWFPIEIFATVLILDKLLDTIESQREIDRNNRILAKPNSSLKNSLKNQVVRIVDDRNVYDSNAKSIDERYREIVDDLEASINSDLFHLTKTYNFRSSNTKVPNEIELNIMGILYIECEPIDKKINEYLDSYSQFLDEKVFLKTTNLKDMNYKLGVLNYTFGIQHKAEEYSMGGNAEPLIAEIRSYISMVDEFIKHL